MIVTRQTRIGQEASQAMLIHGDIRLSQLSRCIDAAPVYQLNGSETRDIIDAQVDAIRRCWNTVAQEVQLSEIDHKTLVSRAFFNPLAFEDYGPLPPLPKLK